MLSLLHLAQASGTELEMRTHGEGDASGDSPGRPSPAETGSRTWGARAARELQCSPVCALWGGVAGGPASVGSELTVGPALRRVLKLRSCHLGIRL